MTLQLASDLHIEFFNDEIPNVFDYITPSAPHLLLAGDIGSLYKIEQLYGFLKALSPHFESILYIPGNHEYYQVPHYPPLSIETLTGRLESLEQRISNLYILNRSSVRINNLCIIGCTLWSRPECLVPPFIVRIHNFNSHSYLEAHRSDLAYIEEMMTYCKQKGYIPVVSTHHPPTLQALQGAKKRKQFVSLYATDLEGFIREHKPNTWICGHTHKNLDIQVGSCRIVSNQKGKPKDRVTDYQPNFTLF
jgi:predicted phosphodiesterase